MNRRGFFGSLLALALAPLAKWIPRGSSRFISWDLASAEYSDYVIYEVPFDANCRSVLTFKGDPGVAGYAVYRDHLGGERSARAWRKALRLQSAGRVFDPARLPS